MKKIVSFIVMGAFVVPAFAVTPMGAGAGRGRAAAAAANGARATSSVNQLNAMAAMATMTTGNLNGNTTIQQPSGSGNSNNSGNSGNAGNTGNSGAGDQNQPGNEPQEPAKDMREKEKKICLNNNIGMGNTFVWASRYSNLNNYSSMIEDIDSPENNTCFVKVEMKSEDSKISVADIPAKYFEMGQTVTCGSWADEEKLKKRILDAKKSARTWGTVAGVAGGAAVGVGAMELFGNKLIGGSVQGQKALSGDELLYSQLAVMKKENNSKYQQIMSQLRNLKKECDSDIWNDSAAKKPEACSQIGYDRLLQLETM